MLHTAVAFVGHISTVVVAVTLPTSRNTSSCVRALELIITARCTVTQWHSINHWVYWRVLFTKHVCFFFIFLARDSA